VTASEHESTTSGELTATVGELELCYETFGASDAPPLLLVMGLASQMIMWDEEFCELLAARDFRVVRFDNRDVGRSTRLRGARIPRRLQLIRRSSKGAAYSLDEMATDAVGLLDQLEVPAAHIVGVSMGGMIAQLMAINHPDRVRSLVSIMSSTGNRHVGRTRPRLAMWMMRRARRDHDGYIQEHLDTWTAIGSPGFDFDEERERERAERCFKRGVYPAGSARQLAAVLTAADRTAALANVRIPTAVIHGDADPLIDISGGRATAEAIPDAELVVLEGMGHDLPRGLWPQIIDTIAHTAARAAG